jgi:hypothetical protein
MLNLNHKQRESLLDYTFSIGFGFFLLYHTSFNEIGIPWFFALIVFNVLMQLYKAAYKSVLMERMEEYDDD